MSLKTDNVQIGLSSTATDNFTIRQPGTPDGTVRIANGNSGTTTDLVTVTSAGKVGVGTSSPSTTLHVTSTGAPYIRVSRATQSQDNVGYQIEGGTSGTTWLMYQPASSNDLRFYGGAADRMTIDSSGYLKFDSGYGSAATAYGCRAWVNFNGNSGGSPAIRVAKNVSSITDFGDSYYGINFTTAMPDANFAWSANGSNVNNTDGTNYSGYISSTGNISTTNLTIRGLNIYNGGANFNGDPAIVTVAVFR